MKRSRNHNTYFVRPVHRYPYPNAAEPGYFAGKVLDVITAAVTCMGTITLFFYLATI
jgi:hypothetical protein